MILELKNVTKQFGGLTAVDNVSFSLPKGQILGLIGPNGAGKTTLFNCISGVYSLTSGQVIFNQQDITDCKPYHAAHLGLARTHQIVRPLNELTVRENVTVGACFGREDHGLVEATRIADEIMEFVGLEERADVLAGSLNVAQKKRLEMARALAARPYLLLLDEVLAGLNLSEVAEMLDTIYQIQEKGISIIMIEHIMHAVMNVSDHVIVLNYGELIAEGTPEAVAENPQVIEAYLGSPELADKLLED
ncbi:MAG: ABC transporter ATP-binding protein [Chloroflexi bacterium]|nr:ABC transporter ATP-binding protein [Chloroflexota bacterium]